MKKPPELPFKSFELTRTSNAVGIAEGGLAREVLESVSCSGNESQKKWLVIQVVCIVKFIMKTIVLAIVVTWNHGIQQIMPPYGMDPCKGPQEW